MIWVEGGGCLGGCFDPELTRVISRLEPSRPSIVGKLGIVFVDGLVGIDVVMGDRLVWGFGYWCDDLEANELTFGTRTISTIGFCGLLTVRSKTSPPVDLCCGGGIGAAGITGEPKLNGFIGTNCSLGLP